jgi:hypothetical protein
MIDFLKENWLWILLPFVIVLGGLLLLMWTGSGEESVAPFQYNVF